jgi:hypothetical protein
VTTSGEALITLVFRLFSDVQRRVQISRDAVVSAWGHVGARVAVTPGVKRLPPVGSMFFSVGLGVNGLR